MSDVRVVVVDDSAAMRALFCDILDQAKGVSVVGVARNVNEARGVIAEKKPDVLTLDVEMPGMTGMEFLEELMSTAPMPVIMLSSITQEGTGTAEKALQLGAVHCFPKPLHTSQEEFSATVTQLGDIVVKAAAGELTGADANSGSRSYQPDGRIVALTGGVDGIDALRELLAAYPSNCPPTIVVLDVDKDGVEKAVATMRSSVACTIKDAEDGALLTAGTVFLAYDPGSHVMIEHGDVPQMRVVDRPPVSGIRPCADLLFGSLSRAGVPTIGGALLGNGADGAKGLQMLQSAGQLTFVQRPVEYKARGRFDAVNALGADIDVLTQQDAPNWILDQTNSASDAGDGDPALAA